MEIQRRCCLTMAIGLLIALGWWPAATKAGAGPVVDVTASDFEFTPAAVTISPGTTVSWTNAGGFHSVVADDGSFTSGDPAASFTFVRRFDTPGVYRYYCAVHGAPNGVGMSGIITVTGSQTFVYLPLVQK